MIRKFFHNILLRRHFWRYATFSQVAEIYVSRMLRMTALHLVSVFISIYLYQIGYSVAVIALFWTGFYVFKGLMALPAAQLVAWIGPKHTIFFSNIMYIPAMLLFTFLTADNINLLLIILAIQALSTTTYNTAHAVGFSKVKSMQHAGKEIAFMNIFEKVASGAGPLLGGLLAYFWGPQAVIIIAAMLFALAAAPLFKTGEPVQVNQRLRFRGFSWRLLRRHTVSQVAAGFDLFASGTAWTLYVAIVIVGVSSTENDVYAVMGALTSVVFVVAILASYIYGRLVDSRRGGDLMRVAALGNSLTHLMRPFVQTPITVAGLNAVNELAKTGYLLPYTRGLYDNADLSGARILYLGYVEVLSSIGSALASLLLAFVVLSVQDVDGMRYFFFISATVLLLILTARFPLYKKR